MREAARLRKNERQKRKKMMKKKYCKQTSRFEMKEIRYNPNHPSAKNNINDLAIFIDSEGQDIVKTNYWDTSLAKQGFLYLSWNAGAARLLVPDCIFKPRMISEMNTAKDIIISRGFRYETMSEAIEILFDDFSPNPFCLQLDIQQCDRLLSETRRTGLTLSVWTCKGKQAEFSANYRKVSRIPCLQAWEREVA